MITGGFTEQSAATFNFWNISERLLACLQVSTTYADEVAVPGLVEVSFQWKES